VYKGELKKANSCELQNSGSQAYKVFNSLGQGMTRNGRIYSLPGNTFNGISEYVREDCFKDHAMNT
jgi:hypothetical protein